MMAPKPPAATAVTDRKASDCSERPPNVPFDLSAVDAGNWDGRISVRHPVEACALETRWSRRREPPHPGCRGRNLARDR